MALGVDETYSYPGSRRSGFNAGDVLLIGTDGIWETRNTSSKRFGKERVGKIARSHHHLAAGRILQAVLDALAEFRGKARQEDDVTLLVLKAKATRRRSAAD
jgi:sigma-B regulation protein RsbU (phosphoserine phosphatase)